MSHNTITFPTVEAALAELGRKVLGVEIHIEAEVVLPAPKPVPTIPPLAPGWLFYGDGPLLHPAQTGGNVARLHSTGWNYENYWAGTGALEGKHYAIRAGTELAFLNGLESKPPADTPSELQEEMTAWREACQRKDADIDTLLARDEDRDAAIKELEAGNERLQAEWQVAVTDLLAQREEAMRLSALLDKCLSGNRAMVVRTQELEASETKYQNYWKDACETIKRLTKERNELHEWKAAVQAQCRRD